MVEPKRRCGGPQEFVILYKATDRVTVDVVLQHTLNSLASDPLLLSTLDKQLSNNSDVEKMLRLARIRSKLLALSREGAIHPIKDREPGASTRYEGEADQDHLFSISWGEFASFVGSFGINAKLVSDIESCFRSSIETEVKPVKAVSVTVAPSDLIAPDDDDDSLWDPEILAMVRAEEERKKDKRRKQIPGKQPRTDIGRLAVKIAWHAEVDTGQKIGPKEIMARLCDLAAKDSDKVCLLYCDVSQPGRERVRWSSDEGIEKWFGREDCKKVVRTWRKSIAQPSKSLVKVGARKPSRVIPRPI